VSRVRGQFVDGGGAVPARKWSRVLLSVLGFLEVLAAVGAAPAALVATGVAGGLLVAAAPWLPVTSRVLLTVLIIGSAPFAALTWSSIATPLIMVLVLGIGLGQLRTPRPRTPLGGTPAEGS
jgi:hypothetical protein